MAVPEILKTVEDSLRSNGWAITAWRSGTDDDGGHWGEIDVKGTITGIPVVLTTFRQEGSSSAKVVERLQADAVEWLGESDLGRLVLHLDKSTVYLRAKAATIYTEAAQVEKRAQAARVQAFLSDVRGYLGDTPWELDGSPTNPGGHLWLKADLDSDTDQRLARRLGFGHHARALLGEDVTLQVDDGEWRLHGPTPAVLAFVKGHDITLDWSGLDRQIEQVSKGLSDQERGLTKRREALDELRRLRESV